MGILRGCTNSNLNSLAVQMTTSQTEAVSRFTELTEQALMSFCGGISSTFGVDMDFVAKAISSETVSGLKGRFNKLTVVNIMDSEGFDGTFQIIDRKSVV